MCRTRNIGQFLFFFGGRIKKTRMVGYWNVLLHALTKQNVTFLFLSMIKGSNNIPFLVFYYEFWNVSMDFVSGKFTGIFCFDC